MNSQPRSIFGPQHFFHEQRMARAREIAAQFQVKFDVLAIGLYGSLARGSDGPYSDIEMYCVVQGAGIDTTYEWSAGAWKAEINVQSADVVINWASEFDEFWPLTHGSCVYILPLCDHHKFFESLKDYVFDHSDDEFADLVRGVIVGELYEFVGKIRNVAANGKTENLSWLALEMAKYGAYLIGLANRVLYTSSSSMFSESLNLADRPNGYTHLCQLVMTGKLDNPTEIFQAADEFWEGIETWASQKSITLYHDLEDLLE